MPKETYLNLKEEKKERVYNAMLEEFTRVPLEEVSVKNIALEAGIARGSFYQYFDDKEAALRFLIAQTREEGEKEIRLKEGEEGDIYSFVQAILNRELGFVERNEISTRAKLLLQIAKSSRSTDIFFQEIRDTILNEERYSNFWERAGLENLQANERDVVVEMLFTSLRHSAIMVIRDKRSPEDARWSLNMKVSIIKEGVARSFID